MKHITFFISLLILPLCAFSQCDYSYGKWDTTLASMPEGRYVFSAITYNDSIYILGGARSNTSTTDYISSVDVYIPSTDTWITGITEIPFPRGCPNVCLIGNKIYVIGGLKLTSGAPVFYDSVHIYDIRSNTWETGQSIPATLSVAGIDTLNGKIYAAGGGTSGWDIVKSLYVYDPELDEWTEKASMNTSRRAPRAQSWNGKFYVFGGYSGSAWSVDNSIEVYYPEEDKWTLLTNANTPRTVMAMSLFKNQLFVFGGIHGYSGSTNYFTNIISRYDLPSDSWFDFHSQGDNIPGMRVFPATAIVDDKIYLFSGYYDEVYNNVWSYALKNIQQVKEINDTTFNSESLDIDLAEYFSTTGEEELNYGVCSGYDKEIGTVSIENSILTINKSAHGGGSTEITVNAFNTEDTISSNTFTLNIPVGIQTYNASELSVYPNPVVDRLCVEFEKVVKLKTHIELMDISGKVVYMETPDYNGTELTIRLTEYVAGIYFLKVQIGENLMVKKVIKVE